jgi:NAD(P)-dependent dehydrogenase (short-subunit alcohol dehydrogenase family)
VEGRVALVTGAGRGIGRATALLLASRGARVLGVSRTAGELDALAREAPIEVLVESVATTGGCARIVAEAERRLGPVEILVNNAGVGSAREREIWRQEPTVWRESLAVNLDAPFELTRLVAGGMVERRYGRIVMVCSTASLAAGFAPGMSAYVAGKHGLLGLTRAVALEVAPYGVTCNAVLPGSVRTQTSERKVEQEAEQAGITVEEAWAARVARTRAGRLVTAEEVAAAIAFLASDEASAVNGVALEVSLQPHG